jgi:cobalt-precorrin-5B (C1)-methyltransferase
MCQSGAPAQPSGPPLRSGFTTGACAAAVARAAVRALVTGLPVAEVAIDLPVAKNVMFCVSRCEIEPGRVTCATVKDSGDDPDVTQGAEIVATAEWVEARGIRLAGGPGVGVVTRPGLAVEVGQPAINPSPRRMITQAVSAELGDMTRGVKVTISVPGGEALAEQTMNPRLGIVGGISILGSTGVVHPYSLAAYRATIHLALKVAASNGMSRVVLATGRRSETYAQGRYPEWPDLSFVEVGDYVGYALALVRRLRFEGVVVAGMVGKLSKLAQGRWQTHVNHGAVDMDFLADLAQRLGAGAALVARCRAANTARHVQVLLRRGGVAGLEERIAALAAQRVGEHAGGAFDVEVLVYEINGTLAGRGWVERTL